MRDGRGREHGFDLVGFDLDDTLYPYAEYARSGLREAARYLGDRTGRYLDDELVALYFEEGVTDGTFDVLLDRHDLDPGLTGDLVEAFHGAEEPLTPYPETERVLSRLGRDHQVGVITDGRNGRAKIRRLGISNYLDGVVATPPLGLSKHQVEPFERLLSALEVDPERAVYVGDDPRVDFRVPNDLGMTTVRLRRGRYRSLEPAEAAAAPDLEIDRLGRLLAVLGDRGAAEA